MEKYTVNGVEFEYDTFDLDNMEIFDSEARRIADFSQTLRTNSGFKELREYVEMVHDFFDAVVSEGTADLIFGGRLNVRETRDAFVQFFNGVTDAVEVFRNDGTIREQRRTMDRKRRRQEARMRESET